MELFLSILTTIIILNTILSIFVVIRKPRDIAATWAWLLVLILLPGVGLLLYMFCGRGLSKKRINRVQKSYVKGLNSTIDHQKLVMSKYNDYFDPDTEQVIKLFFGINSAPLLSTEIPEIFKNSDEFFTKLFQLIENAKKSIYVEFYSIYSDRIGHQFRDALIKKAKEGVKVYVLYDGWGSMGVPHRFWKPLVKAGGHVELFFSSRFIFIDFRLNYRDHRKIVVVDEEFGLIGGYNIGDQYLGRLQRFGKWRDTHILLKGAPVKALLTRFVMDYNATVSSDKEISYPKIYNENKITKKGFVQLVSSGPDEDIDQIEFGLIKLISNAKKRIWLQTPYLVPNESFEDALITAVKSGIDIRIMIPSFPDHPFIYRATQYYANYLHSFGIKIYIYQDGFLHAKTSVIDNSIASVGSANLDIRSFKLNFETTAFIYDKDFNHDLAEVFENDIKKCTLLNDDMIKHQSGYLRFKQAFSRLLSPIL